MQLEKEEKKNTVLMTAETIHCISVIMKSENTHNWRYNICHMLRAKRLHLGSLPLNIVVGPIN